METIASPDGKWLAELTRIDCSPINEIEVYAFERLDLISQADGSRVPLATQLQACGGLGAAGLSSLGWSENSRFIYYTDAAEGVPDGMTCNWERPVYAYDTLNDVRAILSDGPVSPDGSTLAFRADGSLFTWDRNTGETAGLPVAIPGWFSGARSWSPDGNSLAYLQSESDCYPLGQSVLVLVNLTDGTHAIYLQEHEPPFRNVEWREDRRILLFTEDGAEWKFDPQTGKVELEE